MTKQEFIKRVGEGYSDAYEDANLLYMALPNTDKDLFCALWALEKQTGFDIFGTLRKWVCEGDIKPVDVKDGHKLYRLGDVYGRSARMVNNVWDMPKVHGK